MSAELLYVDDEPRLSDVVAGNVRAEAARAGYSQTSLARALDISQATVNPRWRGMRAWSLDELSAIADVISVDLTELLTNKVPAGGSHQQGHWRARRDSNPQPSDWRSGLGEVVSLSAFMARRAA